MTMKWTPDQQAVIEYNTKKDLLVSAAAGSGKTAVMTERVKQRCLQGKSDISQMLIMTFTDLAAQNMRDRIDRSFRQTLEDNIENDGEQVERDLLNHQIMQLQQAQISTIHSFCWQIIQTWSSDLINSDGTPLFEAGFGVLDDTRRQMLLEQAVDEVLNSLYSLDAEAASEEAAKRKYETVGLELPSHLDDPAPFAIDGNTVSYEQWLSNFRTLLDGFSGRSSDENFRSALIKTLNKIRSLADYEQWCRNRLEEYAVKASNFAASSEYQEYMQNFESLLARAEFGVEELKNLPLFDRLMSGDVKGKEEIGFAPCLKSQVECISKLKAIMSDANPDKWDRVYSVARGVDTSGSMGRRSAEKKEFLTIYYAQIAPLLHLLTGTPDFGKLENYYHEKPLHLFSADINEIEMDMQAVLPLMKRFFETVLLIDRVYLRLKIQEQSIDFSDFEHFALRLLRIPEIRNSYKRQFREIYLDEYQDTNNIQEAIIQQIADDNVFMVGDIKQSIYRFRYANPALFAEKSRGFTDGSLPGVLLKLNRNFRSVPGIVDGINRFFSNFLTYESGEIEYTDGHQLSTEHSAVNSAADDMPERINVIMVNSKESSAQSIYNSDEIRESSGIEREMLAVVYQIRKLLNEDAFKYSDIAILGRTNDACAVAHDQLLSYGIPVTAAGEREFLDSPELRLMEALINLLDNMQQDIPLAAIMRSGLIRPAFSETELMIIRNADQDSQLPEIADRHFYASVLRYRDSGKDDVLRKKIDGFFIVLETWREYERFMSVSELIGLIYEESDLPGRVSRMPAGHERLRDLELFHEWADSFERSRQRGLYNFALYIRKIREKKLKETGFDQVSSVENAVRIVTVHGSKGLEFPVVFLIGADKKIDRVNSGDSLLVSEAGGISAMMMNPDRFEKHMTALHYLHELRNLRADRAESYRLLYVAMTRAEKRLFVTSAVSINSDKGSDSKLRLFSMLESAGGKLPLPRDISASAKSWLDLLLLAGQCEMELDIKSWFEAGGITASAIEQANKYYCYRLFALDWLRSEVYPQTLMLESPEGDSDEVHLDFASINNAAESSGANNASIVANTLVEKWSNRLFQKYPYEEILNVAAKQTVSGLKRLQEQLEIDQSIDNTEDDRLFESNISDSAANQEIKDMSMSMLMPQDAGASVGRLQGAALGSMLHSLFQFIELNTLSTSPTASEIKAQIEKMVDRKIIYPEQLPQALEWTGAIIKYSESEIADNIRKIEADGKSVYREMPFTMAIDLTDCGEQTLIQGMIDCWYKNEDGSVTIIDFKSDRIDAPLTKYDDIIKDRYSLQLNYYSRAIEQSTGLQVKRKIVWLIRYGFSIEI